MAEFAVHQTGDDAARRACCARTYEWGETNVLQRIVHATAKDCGRWLARAVDPSWVAVIALCLWGGMTARRCPDRETVNVLRPIARGAVSDLRLLPRTADGPPIEPAPAAGTRRAARVHNLTLPLRPPIHPYDVSSPPARARYLFPAHRCTSRLHGHAESAEQRASALKSQWQSPWLIWCPPDVRRMVPSPHPTGFRDAESSRVWVRVLAYDLSQQV